MSGPSTEPVVPVPEDQAWVTLAQDEGLTPWTPEEILEVFPDAADYEVEVDSDA